MNRSRYLVVGGISLVLGLVASFNVYLRLQAAKSPSEQMVEAYAAATDLQVGARIGENDIKVIHVPLSALPLDSPRRRADLIGRGVVTPIAKGQFILSVQLAGENAGSGLPSLIPPGMRAVSVRVNDVTSVAGFVTPGTRVDVLMTGAPNGEHRTITVLQNVAVLATGPTLERNARGEAQPASVVTLLVTLDDAERVILASNEGHVQLVLRNPIDTRADEVTSASLQQLYKGLSGPEPVKAARRTTQVKPLPVSAPGTREIQIYTGPQQQTVECQDGGECKEGK